MPLRFPKAAFLWSFPLMAEAATGTAWTPCHTNYPIKPGWSLATAPLAAAQGGWYGRKVPFGPSAPSVYE